MVSKETSSYQFHFGFVVAVASYVLFKLNTKFLLPSIEPASISEGDEQKKWKWRNITNSFLHSIITGFGALYNFAVSPEISDDLIVASTPATVTVVGITVGYFFYDFIDLFQFNCKRSRGLLLHHFLVFICFGLALVTRRYQGYAMVALLVEINSISLHIRQLLILHNVEKDTTFYKFNSYVNIATFLVFRLLALTYQAYWLVKHHTEVPHGVVILGFVTNTVILILNFILLWKVVYKDFFTKVKKAE